MNTTQHRRCICSHIQDENIKLLRDREAWEMYKIDRVIVRYIIYLKYIF